MWGKIKDIYSFGIPWLHLVLAFVDLYGMWGNSYLPWLHLVLAFVQYTACEGISTHSEYPDYTWCLLLYIYKAREGNKGHLHIWNTLITPFVHTARKGHLLIQNTLITPGDCFVRENKGHLLIRNTLLTPGDCFCTFIRHVRGNKGELLIRNTLITSGTCFCTFIRHVRDNKGQLYTHSEYPGWLSFIRHVRENKGHLLIRNTLVLAFVHLYGMRGNIY